MNFDEDNELDELKEKVTRIQRNIEDKGYENYLRNSKKLYPIAGILLICILIVFYLNLQEASSGKFGTYIPLLAILFILSSIVAIYGYFNYYNNLIWKGKKTSQEIDKVVKEYDKSTGKKD